MIVIGQGLRRAALLLHAMQQKDRDWLLGELSKEQRDQLCSLLGELRELGISADKQLVAETLKAKHEPAADAGAIAATSELTLDQLISRVRLLPAVAVAQVLHHEPAEVTAMLLKISAWPWRQELLPQLGLVKRRQVEAQLVKAPENAQKLAEHLLRLLLAKALATSSMQDREETDLPAATSNPRRKVSLLLSGFLRGPSKPGRSTLSARADGR